MSTKDGGSVIVRAMVTVQLRDSITSLAPSFNMSPDEMMTAVLTEHADHIAGFLRGEPGFLLGDRTEQVSIEVPTDVGDAIKAAVERTGGSESDLVTAALSFECLGFAEGPDDGDPYSDLRDR